MPRNGKLVKKVRGISWASLIGHLVTLERFVGCFHQTKTFVPVIVIACFGVYIQVVYTWPCEEALETIFKSLRST